MNEVASWLLAIEIGCLAFCLVFGCLMHLWDRLQTGKTKKSQQRTVLHSAPEKRPQPTTPAETAVPPTAQKHDFEMAIDDVFSIKDHGVVVTGTIKKGCIYENDTVVINGCSYTVNRIHARINETRIHDTDHAAAGTNVGLLLSTMDAKLFHRGDVVTMKALPKNQKKTTFLCDICGKELPVKYQHKGNTCAACSEAKTVRTVQPAPQPQSVTPLTNRSTIDILQNFSDALTKIAFISYLERNSIMGLYCLLLGRGNYKVEAFPGAGHDWDAVFRSITNYAIMHPEVNAEYVMNEAMNLAAHSLCEAEYFTLIMNYVDLYLDEKKKQSVSFTLDLPRILTTLKESIANYNKLCDDERFMRVFEKWKAYLLNKHGLEI